MWVGKSFITLNYWVKKLLTHALAVEPK